MKVAAVIAAGLVGITAGAMAQGHSKGSAGARNNSSMGNARASTPMIQGGPTTSVSRHNRGEENGERLSSAQDQREDRHEAREQRSDRHEARRDRSQRHEARRDRSQQHQDQGQP